MKTLFLLGDSTCAPKEDDKRPETGWGMYFENYIDSSWSVRNLALNGRNYSPFSRKDADQCLEELEAGDFVFISLVIMTARKMQSDTPRRSTFR